MMLICFIGYKGAGKSEAAGALQRNGFQRIKFADGLKDMLRTFGLTEAQIEGDEKEQPCELLCSRTPRHAMQTLGTEWGRECIGKNIWVEQWKRKVKAKLNFDQNVVTDDLRFPNEMTAVRELGGHIVRVVRNGCVGDGHESERYIAQIGADNIILNNGTKEELCETIESVVLRPYMTNRAGVVRGLKFKET